MDKLDQALLGRVLGQLLVSRRVPLPGWHGTHVADAVKGCFCAQEVPGPLGRAYVCLALLGNARVEKEGVDKNEAEREPGADSDDGDPKPGADKNSASNWVASATIWFDELDDPIPAIPHNQRWRYLLYAMLEIVRIFSAKSTQELRAALSAAGAWASAEVMQRLNDWAALGLKLRRNEFANAKDWADPTTLALMQLRTLENCGNSGPLTNAEEWTRIANKRLMRLVFDKVRWNGEMRYTPFAPPLGTKRDTNTEQAWEAARQMLTTGKYAYAQAGLATHVFHARLGMRQVSVDDGAEEVGRRKFYRHSLDEFGRIGCDPGLAAAAQGIRAVLRQTALYCEPPRGLEFEPRLASLPHCFKPYEGQPLPALVTLQVRVREEVARQRIAEAYRLGELWADRVSDPFRGVSSENYLYVHSGVRYLFEHLSRASLRKNLAFLNQQKRYFDQMQKGRIAGLSEAYLSDVAMPGKRPCPVAANPNVNVPEVA